MDYRKYTRDVIVLEEKNREFVHRQEEEIKGYLRVETGSGKGAIRCVIQNVKPYPRKEYTYQLILFGTRSEKTIHAVMGTVPVTRYGTGEVYLRFDPSDVDGQGNHYGRYTTAIIAAVSSGDKSEPLHPVLLGRTGHKEEDQVVTAMGMESNAVKERKIYNQYYADYLKHVCQYLFQVSGYYGEIRPFPNESEGLSKIHWLKIDDPTAMFMVSPGAKYFAEQCGHFLLGKEGEDEERVVYYVAVPGRNRWEEQPDGGASGFRRWIPLREYSQGTEDYGYWIAAIDGISGEIFSEEAC